MYIRFLVTNAQVAGVTEVSMFIQGKRQHEISQGRRQDGEMVRDRITRQTSDKRQRHQMVSIRPSNYVGSGSSAYSKCVVVQTARSRDKIRQVDKKNGRER